MQKSVSTILIFTTIVLLLINFIHTPINNHNFLSTIQLYIIIFLTFILFSLLFSKKPFIFIKNYAFIFTSLIIAEATIYIFKGNYFIEYNNKHYSFHQDNINFQVKSSIPYHPIKYQTSEYTYNSNVNNIGYHDIDWQVSKNENSTRIFCLGDSFTEGDGTHKDSSYVAFLRRNINEKFKNIEVFNAGVCGSDPYFNFRSLQKHIIPFKPDIIVQSFTTNDLFEDIYTRGTQERFQEDGTWKSRYDIWWEPIYASSYIFRILILTVGGYDKYLIKKNKKVEIINESIENTVKLFVEYNEYCKTNNMDFILFTFPFQDDFKIRDETQKIHQLFNARLKEHQIKFHYLRECYDEKMLNEHQNFSAYYWPKDGHHNAQGYKMMAHCIEDILSPILKKRKIEPNTLLN